MNSNDPRSIPDADIANPNVVNQAAVTQATGSSGRLLIYGCSAVFVSGLFLILCAGFGTYYYFTKQVKNYTSETPKVMPTQEYDEREMVKLEARVQEFQRVLETIEVDESDKEASADESVSQAEPPKNESAAKAADSQQASRDTGDIRPEPQQLILSAADLNALIARQPRLRNKLFVKIEDSVITGELSLPLDDFVPGGEGRFFNGSGTFDVSLEDGNLIVQLTDALVSGRPLPQVVMSGIRKQNLAVDLNRDARVSRVIHRFDRIEVEGDRVILTLKEIVPTAKESKQDS